MRSRIVLAVLAILAVLAVGMSAACSSSSTSPSPNNGTNVSIVMNSSNLTTTAYAPNPVMVSVGGTVTWMNNDTTTHTSTSNTGTWDSGAIGPGASFSRQFSTAGTFQYHCTIHPGMIGTVTVQ